MPLCKNTAVKNHIIQLQVPVTDSSTQSESHGEILRSQVPPTPTQLLHLFIYLNINKNVFLPFQSYYVYILFPNMKYL